MASKSRKYPENNIRRFREAAGLTQEQLAEMVVPETSQDMIAKLERGERELTPTWQNKLAVALQKHPNDFFDHNVKAKYFGSILDEWGGMGMNKKSIGLAENNLEPETIFIDAPPGAPYGMGCIDILNDSMAPFMFKGSRAYFTSRESSFDRLINKPAVVWLKDGRFSIRIVRRSAVYGHYDLDAYNDKIMNDCDLEYVAAIKYVEHGN